MNLRVSRSLITAVCLTIAGCGAGQAHPASNLGKGGDDSAEAGTGDGHGDQSESLAAAESSEAAPETTSSEASTTKAGAPTVGRQLHSQRSISLKYTLNLSKKGQGVGVQTGDWKFEEERNIEVKAVNGQDVTALRVAYGRWEIKPLLGMSYSVPTDGKTYLVSAQGGTLRVTQGHEQVTGAELKAVSADYGWVGGQSPLAKALAAAGDTAGAKLDASPALARALIGEIPWSDPNKLSVSSTLLSVSSGPNPTARLDVKAEATLRSDKTVFDLVLKGPVDVDVNTGWVISAALEGEAHPSGSLHHPKRGDLSVDGHGQVTFERSGQIR